MVYTKKIKGIVWGLLVILIGISSCNDNSQRVVNPRYVDYNIPTRVRVRLDAKPNYGDLEYHIDHIDHKIFNDTYLPYGTKLDSAYLDIILSSNVKVKIFNSTTQKTVDWDSTSDKKVDVTGGRLMLTMQINDKVSKVYDMRIMSYGYDPNKLTWRKIGDTLPKAFSDVKVVENSGKHYLLGRTGTATELYELTSFDPLAYRSVPASIPSGFIPSSAVSASGMTWAVTDDGTLYYSKDLMQWTMVDTHGVKCTMVLFEPLKNKESANKMVIVGQSGEKYAFYVASAAEFVEDHELPEGFPVKGAYVYDYKVSGVSTAVVLGGTTSDGSSVKNSYFTSDGINWAPTPYSSGKVSVPMYGGSYVSSTDGLRLFLVGGEYPSGVENHPLKVSDDFGLTWSVLTKDNTLGEELRPRYNAGTAVQETTEGDVVYVFGGVAAGVPTTEIWRGWLDKSGGIINAY